MLPCLRHTIQLQRALKLLHFQTISFNIASPIVCTISFLPGPGDLSHFLPALTTTCPACEYRPPSTGSPLAVERSLRRHFISHHLQPDFTCRICGKEFSRPAKTKRHIEEVHFRSKPHQCSFCGNLFVRKEKLEKHVARCHAEPKMTESNMDISIA